jgi:Ca2+-transporting ATPase
MARPPRDPQRAILSREFLTSVLFYAALITGSTLVTFVWSVRTGSSHPTTIAFMTLALAQVFHLGNARSRSAVLRPAAALANRWAIGAVALSTALQLVAVYVPPIARVLRTAPPSAAEWIVVLACSAVAALVGQALRTRR